jgi:hypothetical protein
LRDTEPGKLKEVLLEKMTSIGAWNIKRISRLSAAELKGLYCRYMRQNRWIGYERCMAILRTGYERTHGTTRHVDRLAEVTAELCDPVDDPVVMAQKQLAIRNAQAAVFEKAVEPITSLPGFSSLSEVRTMLLEESDVVGFAWNMASAPVSKALDLLRSGESAVERTLGDIASCVWQLVPGKVRVTAVSRLVPAHLQPDTMRAARGLDSTLYRLENESGLPIGRPRELFGIPPDATEYYVSGKSKSGGDCSYRVEKVTVGPWYAKQTVFVCPELVSYLRIFAGADERTTALLRMLKGRAIVWAKEREVSFTDLEPFFLPSITTAMVLRETNAYWPMLTDKARRTLEMCGDIAAGRQPRIALWRWWDVVSFAHGMKAALLELWYDLALPRPALPVKAFRESFL